jgi:magnesium transporter
LRDEHLEDLHHMSGILGRTEQARAALGGSAFKRAQYRLPWLLLGLAGSAIATMLMAGYEATLTRNLAIAYFVPAVVYLADAVGTQAEAIAVRSLSLTSSGLSGLMIAELLTGCTIGAVLGLIALPLVWFGFGALDLAVAVAITLVGASTLATTLGFLLPWIFSRLRFDPALGSGPIATVIQDIASLGIYFAVVELVVV